MSIVLDTNVLVSGLLRAGSPPAAVLDLIFSRQVRLAFDEPIFAEYADVLVRPEFGFPVEHVHRHYPLGQRRGVRVLTPREYVTAWAEGQG